MQYLFFAFALFTAFSCGNSKEKELDRLVVSLASEDKEIDSKDWQEIISLINSDKRTFKQGYEKLSKKYNDEQFKILTYQKIRRSWYE